VVGVAPAGIAIVDPSPAFGETLATAVALLVGVVFVRDPNE
jgi:hypothetical protein